MPFRPYIAILCLVSAYAFTARLGSAQVPAGDATQGVERAESTQADGQFQYDGKWKPKGAMLAGVLLPPPALEAITLRIEKDKYEVTVEGEDHADTGTFTLDATTTPKRMTITSTAGPNQGKTFFAIYEIKNANAMRVCYDLSGTAFPTEFKAPKNSQLYLVGYRRQALTLADVTEGLPEISGDEPLADTLSPLRAAEYLDRAALNWQKTKKCATCHSNLFYLAARPALGQVLPDSGEVRRLYEEYRQVRWAKKLPTEAQGFWPIVVGTGLTFNDLQTSGRLSPVAREVLDMMWTVQREDGGWKWPHCDYAPMEIDDHYGVTLAALTVGVAPDGYAETPSAQAGLEKIRTYFSQNPPKSLHHRAMLAWCSLRLTGIATSEERQTTLEELLALQLDDGGWSTAGFLTDWQGLQRKDGQALDTETSDGYGTGFVIVVARELGLRPDDPRLQRGIDWLRSHQRASGKWFTRSPVNDAGNLISNAGSAFAILALQACGEFPGWPLASDTGR